MTLVFNCRICGVPFIDVKRCSTRMYCSLACFGKSKTMRAADPDYFWSLVRKGEGASACWEWIGHKTKDGYGRIVIAKERHRTHRRSWEMANGPIPDGLQVLHRCDNPPCVRPDHLFLGTGSDNAKDMVAKGRNQDTRGEKNPQAKLTLDQVQKLRQRAAEGVSFSALSEAYDIHYQTVYKIVHRLRWSNA